jgi:hypothetical protein
MKRLNSLMLIVLNVAALVFLLSGCGPAPIAMTPTALPHPTLLVEATGVTQTAYPQPTSGAATSTSAPTAASAKVELSILPTGCRRDAAVYE